MEIGNVERLEEKLHEWEQLVGMQKDIVVRMRSWFEDFETLKNADENIRQVIRHDVDPIRESLLVVDEHAERIQKYMENLVCCHMNYVYAPPWVMSKDFAEDSDGEDLDAFII